MSPGPTESPHLEDAKPPVNASMRTAVDDFDWAETALGPRDSWPPTLKTVLSLVMDTAFPMLIMWGPELIQLYNDGYIPIFGDKHPRSLGQPAKECWEDIWGDVGPLLLSVYERGETVFFENLALMMQRHGGYEEAFFTFSYSPIREGDLVRGIICVVNETTAHVLRERETIERAEALAQIDRTKTQFFNDLSHEFRTPLTLMLGPLTDLVNTLPRSEQRESANLARRNALRLLRLVNTLLDFSRLQAGRYDAQYTEMDLGAFARDMCGLFRSAIEGAGLRFIVEVESFAPVYADQSMWEKILLNLLSNALKFTLKGEIRVALHQSGSMAELTVSDTGCGIPESEMPRLFERFHRIHGAKGRSHEGTGIGLALVDELVRLHGGAIAVQSREGSGTTFTLSIPLGLPSRTTPDQIHHEQSVTPGRAEQYLAEVEATMVVSRGISSEKASKKSTGRVLLADDNADLRDYLTRILEPHYDIVAARNGLEALHSLREQRFDVILSDVMMPEMDGFELLGAVRSDAALAGTPFILLSARAGAESALQGLSSGADDYIAKPFSAEDLLARVNSQIRAARRQGSYFQKQSIERWFEYPGDSTTNETIFRAFADQLPTMVFQQDIAGALSFANEAWYRVLHMERETSALTVEAWKTVIHPDDLDRTIHVISDAIPQRLSYELECRLKPSDCDDSAYRWYIVRGVPQFDKVGDFKGWIGSIVDVHEGHMREEGERILRQAATQGEREFRGLAETIPVIVWTADATGWIDWYNKGWYQYTGQTREEAAGWGWQAAHHPEDLPRVMQSWPHSIETGESFEMEFRLRRFDGVFHTMLTRAVPYRDGDGTIQRWYGSNVDIQAQKDLIKRSQRISETLQHVFLPKNLPQFPDLRLDAVYTPAEKEALVGGDWFDAVRLSDGRLLFSIGDVTGHGLEASVVVGRIRQTIFTLGARSDNPGAVLTELNRTLREQDPGVYATAIVGFVSADRTNVTYANAGHPPPILASSRTRPGEVLPIGGVILGVLEEFDSVSHRVSIAPNSVIVLYTDGITEFARDALKAESALCTAASALVGDTNDPSPARTVQAAVLAGAPIVDDAALLVLQFSHVDSVTLRAESDSLTKTWRFHSSDANTARLSRKELMKYISLFASENEDLFAAELILGEILANTVEHAPGLVEIHVDWTAAKPVVTVRDSGPGLAELLHDLPADELDENGRGMFLINTLASDASVKALPGFGTELTVVLPVQRAARPANVRGVE